MKRIALAVALVCSLACSGLMGYGEEVASTPLRSGEPFEVTVQGTGAPLKLWLTYELEYQGDYSLGGKVNLVRGKGDRDTWAVAVTEDAPPVAGGTRISLGKVHSEVNGKGSMKETVKIGDLGTISAGQPLKIKGELTANSGTRLQSATLVVTK